MRLSAHQLRIERSGRCILRVDSLLLHPGELVAVVGPNGAGKSTLLAALAGDTAPDTGKVALNQRDLSRFTPAELARLRAAIGTPPNLAFGFTVRDVVAMGWLHGRTPHSRDFHTALTEVLADCELSALAERTYMTLSSGERQRVQYARACLQLWPVFDFEAPRWLFLDEPTANMDVAHAVHLLAALSARVRQGDGVMVVLHDLDLAARYADRVILVNDGEIDTEGPPEQVLTSERLSRVYGAPIHAELHPVLARLVVIG